MWSTASTFEVEGVSPGDVWSRAYSDPRVWPRWNDALRSVEPEGPFEAGGRTRVRFRTGLRLVFTLVEFEPDRLFTDEARLPGARMGHRHALEPTVAGVRLVNTLYIEGPLERVWSLVMGPSIRRGLPRWQRKTVEVAAAPGGA